MRQEAFEEGVVDEVDRLASVDDEIERPSKGRRAVVPSAVHNVTGSVIVARFKGRRAPFQLVIITDLYSGVRIAIRINHRFKTVRATLRGHASLTAHALVEQSKGTVQTSIRACRNELTDAPSTYPFATNDPAFTLTVPDERSPEDFLSSPGPRWGSTHL